MRHVTLLPALAALSFTITAVLAAPPSAPSAALAERTEMLAPIQVDSLSLRPIAATGPLPADDAQMLVLDEAMAANQVVIQEVGGGAVNSLTFINRASQPVFLLAGEVILGGKQDRIIGRNTVIPAKSTLAIPVYCVEHGRWTNQGDGFTTGKALAHGRLRGQASYAAQQDVWNEVAAKNQARKTTNPSDTYRRVAEQQSDGTLAAMERRVDAALATLSPGDRDRLVGFAVALNGEVVTVDVFGSPALFRKLQTKLVRSYLTEAVDVAARKDARAPTAEAVKSFMADADKAAARSSYDNAAAQTLVNRGDHASKSSVDYRAKAPPPGAASTSTPPARAVYENYQVH